MLRNAALLAVFATAMAAIPDSCPSYTTYSAASHPPLSPGKYQFPYMRPNATCRTYKVPKVEETIKDMKKTIKDPDLFRLFQNTWPNTVDTTVSWTGAAADNANEELAFIITGDIDAMWLRDSANQLQSYKSILADSDEIAALYRGTINLQGRYIRQFPFCESFQPPPEANTTASSKKRSIFRRDTVTPTYNPSVVYECKYELDSLAAHLELSYNYYDATGDLSFFKKFDWVNTIKTILNTTNSMKQGTYTTNGTVIPSPYTWERDSDRSTETVANNGIGEPVIGGSGLIRSFFRPSDDATTYQFLIPSNMMFSRYLKACAKIMKSINAGMAGEMQAMAADIDRGIEDYAIVSHPKFGKIYAYEVDGYGSQNLMDDANVPSLLSLPFLGYLDMDDKMYQNTRAYILGQSNRYWAWGPVLDGVGGPHDGPGFAWPMSKLMQIFTSDDDNEIVGAIKAIMKSTTGLGLIHESVNTHDESDYTRPWFAWANGLFGQMILDLNTRKPNLLKRSYQ